MKLKLPKTSDYCVQHGKKFNLKNFDPDAARGRHLKDQAHDLLKQGIAELSDLQQKLYAQDHWSVLLILQGMDSAGKDSVIRHVMSGVNPEGCQVFSFKTPSADDLSHDFLWRTSKSLPQRGHIGIFNRSYYEEVLIARVHPDLLEKENLPPSLVSENIWQQRFEDINALEQYLSRNGTLIRKFFLHLSKEEQKKRFLSRLDRPDKNWKFSQDDVREREHWNHYQHAYQEAIRHTATPHAPWYIVPADHKWFAHLLVASVIIETLQSLKLAYPKTDSAKKQELQAARELLLNER